MWEKSFRYSIFSAVYELLFWREQNLERDVVDWTFILENLKFEQTPTVNELEKILEYFNQNEEGFEKVLQQYLTTWDKTYPIVRACLFTFLLEWNLVKQNYRQNNLRNNKFKTKSLEIIEKELITEKEVLVQNSEDLKSIQPVEIFDPNKEIITKYIRLSEDFIGGQNVGLVHAILSKIVVEIQ